MLTPRENLLRLYRREGYESAPLGLHLCPSLIEEFKRHYPGEEDYLETFNAPSREACAVDRERHARLRARDGVEVAGGPIDGRHRFQERSAGAEGEDFLRAR